MVDGSFALFGELPLATTDFILPAGDRGDIEATVAALRMMQVIPRRLIAPMFVLLDITSECSLQCGYCYNQSGIAKPVRMDRSRLFALADEIIRMRVFSVCVCGGEPTLHPHFVDAIRHFREGNVLGSSITNGWDVDDDLAREMARNLAIVQVTFDGPDAATHDRLRGKGSFDRAIKTVERLKRHGLHQLRVAFTCTRHNIAAFPRMLEFCFDIGADDLRTMQLVPVGRAYRNKGFEAETAAVDTVKQQAAAWASDPSINRRLSVEWGSPHEHIRVGLSYGYLLGVNISAEGFYKLSPYLPIAFGRAGRVSLQAAWDRGLGEGWRLQKVRPIFESIESVDSYRAAYEAVLADPEVKDGYLDVFELCADAGIDGKTAAA